MRAGGKRRATAVDTEEEHPHRLFGHSEVDHEPIGGAARGWGEADTIKETQAQEPAPRPDQALDVEAVAHRKEQFPPDDPVTNRAVSAEVDPLDCRWCGRREPRACAARGPDRRTVGNERHCAFRHAKIFVDALIPFLNGRKRTSYLALNIG